MKATNAHGFNIILNNNEAAGQAVFHAHFHIVPRFTNDGKLWPHAKGSYKDGEAVSIASKIKSLL